MTNTTNSSLQWEVAGGKKLSTKKVTNTEVNGVKLLNGKPSTSKIPKLSTNPPLKTDSTIYDLIRESDDDSDDSNNNKKKQETKTTKKQNGTSSLPVSPKQTQKQQEQPLNLLKTSIMTSQKKSPKPSLSPKKAVNELETAFSELSFEAIQIEYSKLEKLFPDNIAAVFLNLATFVNQMLNHIPDIESSHVGEPNLSKMDKKIEKFLNNLINKLKRADSEYVLENCFNLIFADNPRILSHHGIILFIQMLLRQTPNLLVNSFSKCLDLINSNKHKHQRVLIAFRALSQIGVSNLSEGIKIWFDIMLPLITTKSLSNYIATYLSFLFDHHKSNISKLTNIESLIDCDQYLEFYDFVNDKTLVLSKEAGLKLKTSFQQIRNIFFQNLSNSDYFEPILSNLSAESSAKQTELLEILTKIVFSNRDTLTKWHKIYSKTLLQSTIFLEHLVKTRGKSLKSLKGMRETLQFFDQQTTLQLAAVNKETVGKETPVSKHHHFGKKTQKSASTIETERLKSFNKLVKQLIKQNFQRTSFISMAFRSFLLIALLTGGFFYWDVNQNRSTYVNTIQSELKRYGLLEQTLKVAETFENHYISVKNAVNHHVPIWYNKTMIVVVPFANKVWTQTVEYSDLAWNKSEPYRQLALVYYEQSKQYIQTNFPVLVEKFLKFLEIALENATIAFNQTVVYFNQAKDFAEVKMGMEKGELDRIFLDAYQILLQKVTLGVQWLNENLTNVY